VSRTGIALATIACLLAISASTLWLRSITTVDWITINKLPAVDRGLMIWSAGGVAAISLTKPSEGIAIDLHAAFAYQPDQHHWRVDRSTYAKHREVGVAGVSLSKIRWRTPPSPSDIMETLLLPYWLPCVLAALLVSTAFIFDRTRKPRSAREVETPTRPRPESPAPDQT
jgi:hypothetical protein